MGHIEVYNHHVQLPYVVLAIIEFFVLAICGYLSVAYAEVEYIIGLQNLDLASMHYGLIFALVMSLSTVAMGIYAAGFSEGFISMMVRTVVSYCLLGALAMLILGYMIPLVAFGRGELFTGVLLSLVAIVLLRAAFYALVDNGLLKKRILILGAGHRAKLIQDNIANEDFIGSEVVGFVPSDSSVCEVDEKLLLKPIDGIKGLVDQYRVDEIVVAVDERRRDKGGYFPLEDLLDCKLTGTSITAVVDFYEREFNRIDLAEINTSWMVFSDQFRYSRIRDLGKRLFDLIISLVLLVLAWPLMAFTAVAVFLESGMPILYTQERVGLNGKAFKIYKFRSMRQDAEKDGKAVWAKVGDARVTRVGAFIRNTRLDELPQIFNVLCGDMSFVGPRPERPQFVDDLAKELPFYEARHRVKPGLMGWAQLKYSYGASVDDAANKLVYDLYYVKNQSLLLDLLIVVQSVEIILLGKGVR